MLKLQELDSMLGGVEGFSSPKVNLEQYITTPHLAACILHTAESQFGDISSKCVVDLGCGCGVLSVGASLMGAGSCLGVDIDMDALNTFQKNVFEFELENIEVLHTDVLKLNERKLLMNRKFDTVIMNPPFGTKNNKGIDIKFLEVASKLARTSIYSLHKSTTREFVLRKGNQLGLSPNVLAG